VEAKVVHVSPVEPDDEVDSIRTEPFLQDAGEGKRHFPQFVRPLGIFRPQDRARATIDQILVMKPTPDGLMVYLDSIIFLEEHRDRGTGPTAAEEAEVDRCYGRNPSNSPGSDLLDMKTA
jgi:hypothetical protein